MDQDFIFYLFSFVLFVCRFILIIFLLWSVLRAIGLTPETRKAHTGNALSFGWNGEDNKWKSQDNFFYFFKFACIPHCSGNGIFKVLIMGFFVFGLDCTSGNTIGNSEKAEASSKQVVFCPLYDYEIARKITFRKYFKGKDEKLWYIIYMLVQSSLVFEIWRK